MTDTFVPAPWVVGVAGQSLCTAPSGGTTTFAYKALNTVAPYRIRAMTGTGWVILLSVASRDLYPVIKEASDAALVMCGSQTDIWDGATAQQVYDRNVSYADAATTAGFGPIVVITIPPNTTNTGGMETIRQAANTLLLSSFATDVANGHVCDLTGNTNLENEGSTTYYYDGVHWTEASTQIVADLLEPVLLPLLT